MLPPTRHPKLSDRPFMRARFPSLHDVRNEARRAIVNSMRMLQLIAGDPDEDGVIDPREQRLAATALLRSVPAALKSLDKIEEQLADSPESTDTPSSPASPSFGSDSAGAPASDPSDSSNSRPDSNSDSDSTAADSAADSPQSENSAADSDSATDDAVNSDDPAPADQRPGRVPGRAARTEIVGRTAVRETG